MSLTKTLRRIANTILLGLSGTVFVNCAAYGSDMPYVPPIPHDNTLRILDFSYTPASPVHAGDQLTFAARLNKRLLGGHLLAWVGPSQAYSVPLYDGGEFGDGVAGDLLYSYSGQLRNWPAPAADLPVTVKVMWDDAANGVKLSAPPLTILPAEGGQ